MKQPQWFNRWPWLHYNEHKDIVSLYKNHHLHSVSSMEQTFISTRFSNWKDAFNKHEASQCHKGSVLKNSTLPSTTGDIEEALSSQLAKQQIERRKCFLKLLLNIRFLSRKPFRGDGDESDSNFMQLLTLRSKHDGSLINWMKQKTNKYTSAEMQNEMMKVLALRVL